MMRQSAYRLGKIFAFAVLLPTLLTSCVGSESPLCEAGAARVDERLLRVWKLQAPHADEFGSPPATLWRFTFVGRSTDELVTWG